MKKTYEVNVYYDSVYTIEADSKREAEEQAWKYFSECEPNFETVEIENNS